MIKTNKNAILILGLITLLLLMWFFKNIFAYIFISVVFSLIGNPIVNFLNRFNIKGIRIPRAIIAIIALFSIWGLLLLVIQIFMPFVVLITKELSHIDVNMVLGNYKEPLKSLQAIAIDYNLIDGKESFNSYINEKIISVINIAQLSNVFKVVVGIFGDVFIAFFSISFISFFFLKNEKLFYNVISYFVPEKHDSKLKHISLSVKKNLIRYFIGISVEVLLVITLITVGMLIVGLDFNQAIVIGLIAGVMNVIPYLGPILGAILGFTIAIIANIGIDFYSEMLPLLGFMAIVFAIVQVVDNIFFQPYIYSSSINAHPLEIFLVISFAGSAGGIIAMAVAIPVYTIFRVIAKELVNHIE